MITAYGLELSSTTAAASSLVISSFSIILSRFSGFVLGKCLPKTPLKLIEKYQAYAILTKLKPIVDMKTCENILYSVSKRANRQATKLSMLRLGWFMWLCPILWSINILVQSVYNSALLGIFEDYSSLVVNTVIKNIMIHLV